MSKIVNRRAKDSIERKRFLRTNYGPEETDYNYIIKQQVKQNQRNDLKQTLKFQITTKNAEIYNSKMLDKRQEIDDVNMNNEIYSKIKEEENYKKQDLIKTNVENWNLQTRLRQKMNQLQMQ